MRALGAAALLALVAAVAPGGVFAQDTLPPVEGGVRVGITYVPGARPGLAVLRGAVAVADSVRALLERDLDYSDRFEMVVPGAGVAEPPVNYRTLSAMGVEYAVAVEDRRTDAEARGRTEVEIQLHEVRTGAVRNHMALRLPEVGTEAFRFAVHRAADEIVRWLTGTPGVATTRVLFVLGGQLHSVGADGEGPSRVPAAGRPALSPAWSRGGERIAYTAFVRSGQPIVIQDSESGRREVVPATEYGLNITPEFSPDGARLAFAHGGESGTDIFVYDVARRCCVARLTAGRFADNLSPTWSPDGQRIAFISTRARTPQLYWMAADGSGQEVLGRFDFGATGATNGPAWSPDGQHIAFHREVRGTPQVFVLDLATRAVRQLTGTGRNEDPSWAPDGRHLVFASTRTGTRELWVMDLETGRVRQLTRLGGARLPAWSPRLPPPEERE